MKYRKYGSNGLRRFVDRPQALRPPPPRSINNEGKLFCKLNDGHDNRGDECQPGSLHAISCNVTRELVKGQEKREKEGGQGERDPEKERERRSGSFLQQLSTHVRRALA